MMERQPLLSVIVPVYNTSKFLPRCMDSLQKQTYSNIEIIFIDDGSADESPLICDAYASQMANGRVIHKENAGLGMARNSALDIAMGDYVAFLDSDDYIDADMYRALMDAAERTEAQAAFCDFCFLSGDGKKRSGESNIAQGCHEARTFMVGMLGACPDAKRDFDFEMSVCKGIYAADIINANSLRFLSERDVLSEDLFFNITFLQKAERAAYVKLNGYYYCENTDSLTHRYIPDRLRREKHMYASVLRLVNETADKELILRWNRLFLGRVRTMIQQELRYRQDIGFLQRFKAIREIVNDELVREVIGKYPIHKNPIKLRIFHTFLKHKCCIGVCVLIMLNR